MNDIYSANAFRKGQQGYSIMEMLFVVMIVATLVAIAIPSFQRMRQGLEYRQAARDIASALRDARSRAITTNQQHRLELEQIAGRRYRLAQGNRAYNSTIAGWVPLVANWSSVPLSVTLTTTSIPANQVNFEFNPNGTAANVAAGGVTINILDDAGAIRLRVQVMPIGKITIM